MSNSQVFKSDYNPDFAQPSYWVRRPEGFFGKLHDGNENDPQASGRTLYLQINFDGSGYLFCGRAAETRNTDNPPKYFFSSLVAGNATRFLTLLGELYKRAAYFGMVNIGVAVIGIGQSVPSRNLYHLYELPAYEVPDYYRTSRVSAISLKENPKQVAAELLMPLIDAVSQVSTSEIQ